ncbi:MAG: bacillithiol biosynthesis deacetylase BshB1 [Planctomycetota bacterium]
MSVDLLVVGAHPDDAELAVGGTLLRAKREGLRTAVVDLTRGELSSRGDLVTRAAETRRATEILALDHRENLELPDGAVRDSDPARARLADAIRRLRPRFVLAPWKEDLHPDHAGAGWLTERTWYLCGVGKFAAGTEPFRPRGLGFYMCHTPFAATAVVDVTSVWERKLEAVRCYASQFGEALGAPPVAGLPPTKISQPHFLAAIEGRARDHGLLAGCVFGEPLRWEYPVLLGGVGALLMPEVEAP